MAIAMYDPMMASEIFISHFERERPVDWQKEFPVSCPCDVEIGFGCGEFLLDWAGLGEQRNYVGIELDWTRIRKTLGRISRLPCDRKDFIRKHVRLLQADAWTVMQRLFCPKTIAQVICLFPCPWPRERHEAHRLFSRDFLRLVNSRLCDGGQIQCVTDYDPYAAWIEEQAGDTGFEIERQKIPAQFRTKFELKWQAAGQQEFDKVVFQKTRHWPGDIQKDCDVKAYYHPLFRPEAFVLNKYVDDRVAVVPKEWFYDPKQEKAVIRVVVSEEHLTQHLWIGVIKTPKGWCVLRSEGQQVLPSQGVARAIELVSEAVAQTAKGNLSTKE